MLGHTEFRLDKLDGESIVSISRIDSWSRING